MNLRRTIGLGIILSLFIGISTVQGFMDNSEIALPVITTDIKAEEVKTFNDLPLHEAFYTPTWYLAKAGVINGFEDGSIKPFNNLTRAEFLKILFNVKAQQDTSFQLSKAEENPFPDVDKNTWFASYVQTAKDKGIVKGFEDGTFRPDQTISFQETVKVVAEALDLPSTENTSLPYQYREYEDHWVADYLPKIVNNNLSQALNAKTDLAKPIMRGEAFDVLYRGEVVRTQPTPEIYPPRYQSYSFFGGKEVVMAGFSDPFLFPISYNGSLKQVKGTLYRIPKKVFMEARTTNRTDRCCFHKTESRHVVNASLVSQMERIKTFTSTIEEVPEDLRQDYSLRSFIALPIKEKGIYMVRLESKHIAPEDLIIVSSNLSLMSREGRSQTLTWLIDDDSKKQVQGARVSIYGQKDQDIVRLGSEMTDSQGTALFETEKAEIIFAESGQDFALLEKYGGHFPIPEPMPMVREMAADIAVEPLIAPEPMPRRPFPVGGSSEVKIYAYTDRPIYRPGDEVNMKAVLRMWQEGGYDLPSGSVEIKISTHGSRGEDTVFESSKRLSEFGTVHDSFVLSDTAKTGNYAIKLIKDGKTHHAGRFEVESYVKPEFSLTIHPEKPHYILGDEIRASVKAAYQFGEPVTNQHVEYQIFENSYWESPVPYEAAYSIIPPYPGYGGNLIKSGSVSLDQFGEARISWISSASGSCEQNFGLLDEFLSFRGRPPCMEEGGSKTYTIKVASVDASNRPVKTESSLIAHETDFRISAKGPSGAQEGEAVFVDILTTTHEGTPRAFVEGTYVITRSFHEKEDSCEEYFDIMRARIMPRPCFGYQSEDYGSGEFETDANGKYRLRFVPQQGGSYNITIKGRTSFGTRQSSLNVQVIGEGSLSRGDTLILSLDRESYEPGDIAAISAITSEEEGVALLTIASDKLRSHRLIPFSGGSFEATMDIQNAFAPGVRIGVDLPTSDTFLSQTRTMNVTARHKKLDIAVKPGKDSASPREKIDWEISTRDILGNPQQSDLSLMLVDKAIYQMRKASFDEFFNTFWGPRFDPWNPRISSKRPLIESRGRAMPTMMNFGGGLEVEEMAGAVADEAVMRKDMSALPPSPAPVPGGFVRENLLDTAVWIPSIQTAGSGVAHTETVLPDNLTTWVTVALGVTKGTHVGHALGEVKTTKDIVIRPHLPRFITTKDRFEARATIHNFSSESGGFRVALNGSAQKLALDAGASKNVSWDLEVPGNLKDGDIFNIEISVANMSDLSEGDAISIRIPVKGVGVSKTHARSGEGSFSHKVSPESGDHRNIRSLVIDLSPTLADTLLQSLEYLTGYPYGCVEQTMSRFLPTVVAYGARDQLNFSDQSLFDEIDDQVNAGITRLYSFQHTDGGWGWWKDDESTSKNTAYVLYGLTLAKQAGFDVNPDVTRRAVSFLKEQLNNPREYKMHPYIMRVLSMDGIKELPASAVESFLQNHKLDRLSANDLAYLLITSGEGRFKGELQGRIQVEGDLAFIDEEVIDYENMGSKQLSTSNALHALALHDPFNPVVEKLIRYLNESRVGGMYHETHATSNAVIAVVTYLRQVQQSDGRTSFALKLNGETLESGNLDGRRAITIDIGKLKGDDVLEIEKKSGKLYYTMIARELIPKHPTESFDNGFRVTRTYLDRDGFTPKTIKAGDILNVEIDVDPSSEAQYVSILDPLPAGFEAVNEKLETVGTDHYGRYWGVNKDIYDDHVALFETNLGDRRVYSYLIRAVTPGSFVANPTKVEMMYAPERNGASASSLVEIQ